MKRFPYFERRLLELDPDLFLAYDRLIDRWVIFRRVRDIQPFYVVVGGAVQQHNSKPYRHILTIQDPRTGQYAEPIGDLADEIIAWLKRYDTRTRTPQSIADEIDRHNDEVQEARERKHREEMVERHKYYRKAWKRALESS